MIQEEPLLMFLVAIGQSTHKQTRSWLPSRLRREERSDQLTGKRGRKRLAKLEAGLTCGSRQMTVEVRFRRK